MKSVLSSRWALGLAAAVFALVLVASLPGCKQEQPPATTPTPENAAPANAAPANTAPEKAPENAPANKSEHPDHPKK